MLTKIRAIVINTVNYSESSVVLKCYTDLYGLQSYMVNGVKSKKGAIKPSHLMPLNLLDLEAYHWQNKSLQRIKELKCNPMLQHLHFDIIKSSLAIFIAEVIHKSIREENHTEEKLFEFLFSTIHFLDLTEQSLANLPCYFLLQLSRHLGFFPKLNFDDENNSFDLKEGVFKEYADKNTDCLNPEWSKIIFELCNEKFESFDKIQIEKTVRNKLLENIIFYYQLHIFGASEFKSHKILSEVLA